MSYPMVPIGELVTLRQGFAINKNTKHHISDEPTDLPLLRIADMKDKAQNVFVKDTIPSNFIAKPEDIIYTRTGQVGLVFTDQYGVIHNNCFTVTANDRKTLDRYYLYYVLQSDEFYSAANNLASGAAQPDLPHGAFRSIEIPVPPLESQRRIAEILKGHDNLIENNQKQIKLLEEAAQRLYKEWFIDLRFPGHETTPIVDGVPEGWREMYMDDICDSIGGGTPSTKNEEYYRDGQIKWVTPTDITRKSGLILLDTEKKITEEGLQNSSAKMVPPYTILMTSRASVGFFGLCEYEVCTNQGFISCIPHEENVRFYLLYNLMNRVDEIRAKASGSTFLEISKKNFKGLKITIPPAYLLDAFNKIVHPLIRLMEVFTKSIAKLQEARDRLLPKLMSGEIEV